MANDIILNEVKAEIDLQVPPGSKSFYVRLPPGQQTGKKPVLQLSNNYMGASHFDVKNVDRIELGNLSISATQIAAKVWDLILDDPSRRLPNSDPRSMRRALVHDTGDRLTLNWGGDYPGGVLVQGEVDIPKKLTVDGIDVSQELRRLRDEIPTKELRRLRDENPRTDNGDENDVFQELRRLREEVDDLKKQLSALTISAN